MTNNSNENRKDIEELVDPSFYGASANYVIQVKFNENVGARLMPDSSLSSKTSVDLSNVNNILKRYDVKLQRAFDESEESLTSKARESKSRGIDLPDLSRYYVVYTEDKEKAEKL